jgi:hypothetical protein
MAGDAGSMTVLRAITEAQLHADFFEAEAFSALVGGMFSCAYTSTFGTPNEFKLSRIIRSPLKFKHAS